MMENLKEYRGDYGALRCTEAQEVMGRIPSAIVRWGMTVMAVIVGGLFTAACVIPWPQTEECPCIVEADSVRYRVTVRFSPKVTAMLFKEKNAEFSVKIPMLDDLPAVHGNVDIRDMSCEKDGIYTATVSVARQGYNYMQELGIQSFESDAVFIVSDKKLIFHIFHIP